MAGSGKPCLPGTEQVRRLAVVPMFPFTGEWKTLRQKGLDLNAGQLGSLFHTVPETLSEARGLLTGLRHSFPNSVRQPSDKINMLMLSIPVMGAEAFHGSLVTA